MGLELLFELEDAPFLYLLLGGWSLDPCPLVSSGVGTGLAELEGPSGSTKKAQLPALACANEEDF